MKARDILNLPADDETLIGTADVNGERFDIRLSRRPLIGHGGRSMASIDHAELMILIDPSLPAHLQPCIVAHAVCQAWRDSMARTERRAA